MVKNNNLYFFDGTTQSILRFNAKGEFINKLDRKGRGYGEYWDLIDFDVDDNENIYILSYKKILIYNSSLKFIKEKKLQITDKDNELFYPILFLLNGQYTFLFRGSFAIKDFNKKHPFGLCSIDRYDRIISEYFPVKFEYPFIHQAFSISNSNVYVTSTMENDTIFKVHDSMLKPYMVVDFGDKKITDSYIISNRKDLYIRVDKDKLLGGVRYIYDDERYLCFIFNYGVTGYQAVYNKNTKKVIVLNIMNDSLPYPGTTIGGIIGNSFFSIADSYLFAKGGKFYEKYHKLLKDQNISDIKDTDNPLIFKFSFNF